MYLFTCSPRPGPPTPDGGGRVLRLQPIPLMWRQTMMFSRGISPKTKSARRPAVIAVLLASAVLVLAACSSTGGKKAADQATDVSATHANTPRYTIAMITHAAPGDTFWDIVRSGADAAAAKDNVTLKYSNDPDPTKQAALITDAINSKVAGIAVTDPNPAAICPTIQKAVQAGIPV